MPRGIPKAAAGAAHSKGDYEAAWVAFAASALTGALQRNNLRSEECVESAARAADLMMAEREKRFAVAPDAQEDGAE